MGAETRSRRFSEQTIRQVRLDCRRAMTRSHFCPDRSEVVHLRCTDDVAESEHAFGSQLWYFEGMAVDGQGVRKGVYGVVEYSVQFGLLEVVEDGVFDSEYQRERFRHQYHREMHRPSWRQPAHRWLVLGLTVVTVVFLAVLLLQRLAVAG